MIKDEELITLIAERKISYIAIANIQMYWMKYSAIDINNCVDWELKTGWNDVMTSVDINFDSKTNKVSQVRHWPGPTVIIDFKMSSISHSLQS